MKKNTEYKNNFNKSKYDQIILMLPKGEKERIKTIAIDNGKSLNALIYDCILEKHPKNN